MKEVLDAIGLRFHWCFEDSMKRTLPNVFGSLEPLAYPVACFVDITCVVTHTSLCGIATGAACFLLPLSTNVGMMLSEAVEGEKYLK